MSQSYENRFKFQPYGWTFVKSFNSFHTRKIFLFLTILIGIRFIRLRKLFACLIIRSAKSISNSFAWGTNYSCKHCGGFSCSWLSRNACVAQPLSYPILISCWLYTLSQLEPNLLKAICSIQFPGKYVLWFNTVVWVSQRQIPTWAIRNCSVHTLHLRNRDGSNSPLRWAIGKRISTFIICPL